MRWEDWLQLDGETVTTLSTHIQAQELDSDPMLFKPCQAVSSSQRRHQIADVPD